MMTPRGGRVDGFDGFDGFERGWTGERHARTNDRESIANSSFRSSVVRLDIDIDIDSTLDERR
jgi:hypothetical protein